MIYNSRLVLNCLLLACFLLPVIPACNPKLGNGLRKKDLSKDVVLETTKGNITLRLYEETPAHRNNFLKLVKEGYYDSVLFHRVIQNFMIQAGDPLSKRAPDTATLGNGGPDYSVPAEFWQPYFHHKGVLAAARMSDDVNPSKSSSGSQFYIVQGKKFTDSGLDSVEIFRLNGRKIPSEHREVYKSQGGAPHLDQNYTIFGEVMSGLSVVDSIAAVPTNGRQGGDKPLQPVRIIRAKLVSR